MKIQINPAAVFVVALLTVFATVFATGCGGSDDSGSAGSGSDGTISGAGQGPVRVEVVSEGGGFQLTRDGKPYYVNGAGGEGPLDLLAEYGGNSGRLWGIDGNTMRRLDEAHANGLTISVGIWLEQSQKGFDYSDAAAVKKQFDMVIAGVEKYKNHPAVLVWGLGNEMEGYESGDDPNLWKHVESLAAKIREIDPNHPTMTVVAEVPDTKIAAIHEHCPSLDIVGINSYGGCPTVGERYRKAGGTKPYIVTEFGPVGTWEVPKNSIDAIIEPTSNDKCEMYVNAFSKIKADEELCLGSYAFLWGNKQEGTSTWFGMLLPGGNKTNAVDAMSEQWTGKPPENRCPEISAISLAGSDEVEPGELVTVRIETSDPEGDPISAKWKLMQEAPDYITGGHFQETPPSYPGNIKQSDEKSAEIQLPAEAGLYRIYVELDDGNKASATANIPVRVRGKSQIAGDPVPLPYSVYTESDQPQDFAPSGWMGNIGSIIVNPECTESPHSGSTCLECRYDATDNWGGVCWQDPLEDWGEKEGGKNFTGATRMKFWAKGSSGGEVVKFGFGLLGRDNPFYDTTKKEREITLTDQWTEYSFDLEGDTLTRIKTPLVWVVAGSGEKIKFFLDDIVVE